MVVTETVTVSTSKVFRGMAALMVVMAIVTMVVAAGKRVG